MSVPRRLLHSCAMACAFVTLCVTTPRLEPAAAEPGPPPGTSWRRVRVEGHGGVLFAVPNEWQAAASRVAFGGPPTLQLTPPGSAPPAFDIRILIASWNAPGRDTGETLDQLRDGLKEIRKSIPTAGNRPLLDLQGESFRGCYLTDLPLPVPDAGFSYKTQGAGLFDEFVVNFTALTSEPGGRVVASMLETIKSIRREPGGHGGPKSIRLPGHGLVTFQVPESWESLARYEGDTAPPTIEFYPPAGGGFMVIVRPMWPLGTFRPFGLPDARAEVERARKAALSRAGTHDLPVEEIAGVTAKGYSFSYSDKHSKGKPGDWRYITEGAVLLDDLLLSFTISTNDERRPETPALLAVLKTATRDATAEN